MAVMFAYIPSEASDRTGECHRSLLSWKSSRPRTHIATSSGWAGWLLSFTLLIGKRRAPGPLFKMWSDYRPSYTFKWTISIWIEGARRYRSALTQPWEPESPYLLCWAPDQIYTGKPYWALIILRRWRQSTVLWPASVCLGSFAKSLKVWIQWSPQIRKTSQYLLYTTLWLLCNSGCIFKRAYIVYRVICRWRISWGLCLSPLLLLQAGPSWYWDTSSFQVE